MYILLRFSPHNVDDELLGRCADSLNIYRKDLLTAPTQSRLVKLPDLAVNGDAYCHIDPARHIRRSRKHTGRFVDPEPRRPLSEREAGLFYVEITVCLPAIHHLRT